MNVREDYRGKLPGGTHVLHTTKYGTEELLGMRTKVGTTNKDERAFETLALADSGASASIISWDLAKKLNMVVFEARDATLTNASNVPMDVSGRGEVKIQEELGLPHVINVLVSKDLGKEDLVVGREDLKDIGVLHKKFPKTLPERRRIK